MVVMISNNAGFEAGYLYGKYPSKIAHLQNPMDYKTPKKNVSWALDNGVFGAHEKGAIWDQEPFYKYLEKYYWAKPIWAVVPDSVGNRDETLKKWELHHKSVSGFVDNLAFAVQDGMVPEDVPKHADVVFVGGSTSWKWRNLSLWTDNFPRVHVGRVNSYKLLWEAHEAGAESCDGTGWFRGGAERLNELVTYLDESLIKERPQGKLKFA